jgi:hypothetical protein
MVNARICNNDFTPLGCLLSKANFDPHICRVLHHYMCRSIPHIRNIQVRTVTGHIMHMEGSISVGNSPLPRAENLYHCPMQRGACYTIPHNTMDVGVGKRKKKEEKEGHGGDELLGTRD